MYLLIIEIFIDDRVVMNERQDTIEGGKEFITKQTIYFVLAELTTISVKLNYQHWKSVNKDQDRNANNQIVETINMLQHNNDIIVFILFKDLIKIGRI